MQLYKVMVAVFLSISIKAAELNDAVNKQLEDIAKLPLSEFKTKFLTDFKDGIPSAYQAKSIIETLKRNDETPILTTKKINFLKKKMNVDINTKVNNIITLLAAESSVASSNGDFRKLTILLQSGADPLYEISPSIHPIKMTEIFSSDPIKYPYAQAVNLLLLAYVTDPIRRMKQLLEDIKTTAQ